MTEIEEIRLKMSCLNKEICLLKNQLHELDRKQNLLRQKKLLPLVGRTFRNGEKVFIVTDVPQVKIGRSGEYLFNPYQIPVYIWGGGNAFHQFYDDGDCDLVFDTIFSKACDATKKDALEVFIEEGNIEITKEQYYEIIKKGIDSIYQSADLAKELIDNESM